MTRDLTRRPLDIGARIDQGFDFWLAYNKRLETVEALVAAVRGEPLLLAALAKMLVRSVRDERRRLRRLLLAQFGLKVTGSYPRTGMRIKNWERARPETLIGVVRRYDLLTGYMVLDTAFWAIGRAAKGTSLAKEVDDMVRLWWAGKYGVLRSPRQSTSVAEAIIHAYIYVMRNAPIAHSALTSSSEGPPAQARLQEAATGLLSAWVRSQIKMYGSLEAALAEEGDPQEVLRQELPSAVMAEIAELDAACSDPERIAELMEELGQRGVYKFLRNRVVNRLRTSGSAQKAEARETARKNHGITATAPRVQEPKERGIRPTLKPPLPEDVDIADFELEETMHQLLGQLEGWVQAASFSGREAQVHELDMRTNFDTAAIARKLEIPAKKVRDYRSRYQAKIKRAAGL